MFDEKISEMNEGISERFAPYTHEKRTYTVEEIQSILGVGRNSAYKLVKSKVFRSVRIGGNIRISKSSFDKWLDEAEVQADE